jgi:drug/metabolite transporter (DMT)-like permease
MTGAIIRSSKSGALHPSTLRAAYPAVGLGLAILIWGANWPIMKAGLAHVTPIWFSALRFGSGACCLFALQASRGRTTGQIVETFRTWCRSDFCR